MPVTSPNPLNPSLVDVIHRYKANPESVYNTWFVSGEARMKAFRAIRCGVQDAVSAIVAGTFGNDFRGSPLEVVLGAITEQKQVFEGAAHPFYWKPKLRIPDIYENEENKRIFGNFLNACLNATREDQVLQAISRLDEARIKGLGPAVANIVYFLHPTLIPPFNTAILNGYNALFGARQKLGSWDSYRAMRETMVQVNNEHRNLLSKDLGAIAGLLFEIGSNQLIISGNADAALQDLEEKAAKAAAVRHKEIVADQQEASEHTQVQHALIKIGRALNYDVFVARNDQHRTCCGDDFSLLTTPRLPALGVAPDVLATVELIDVIWLKRAEPRVVCAFEIEHSTSIFSGILRMKDLAHSLTGEASQFYLVAPTAREKEVAIQMARPSLYEAKNSFRLGYLRSEDVKEHCDGMCKFGGDYTVLARIAQTQSTTQQR
jgi:type II restriction enzyme